jgi:phage-related baseplate assembly protein
LPRSRSASRQGLPRDDKKELLPAVQKALSEEQVQTIAEKFETGLAEGRDCNLSAKLHTSAWRRSG